jgi:lipoate-protein ligase A
MRQWRFIYDSPLSGAENMARDDAILHAVSAGQQPPTLRIYAWQPFCLSLGYGQNSSDADQERLQVNHYDIVRRPTGGRAILHGDELTYSLSLPIQHELAQGDVIASYRNISRGLVQMLQHLGLEVRSEAQDHEALRQSGPVCFEIPSHYEITVNDKKLIGSAQVRRRDGILQHGTLPVWGDVGRICDVLVYPDDAERQSAKNYVQSRATTLSDVLQESVTWDAVRDAMLQGFTRAFDVEWLHQSLSDEEIRRAQQLKQKTYANPDWTFKR